MTPWERRLHDLWLLLERCHATYMEPELFRLSANQFLQTARTVTFIIQKNGKDIPDFHAWYDPIMECWGRDEVMRWAKDARNKIEKEGDLDLYSTLNLTLFFSYLQEQDIRIETGKEELLLAGTKRLTRIARQHLPSPIVDAAAIKLERRWVANSLPHWELLHAFNYVYAAMYRMSVDLARYRGTELVSSIRDPTDLYPAREAARQVAYLKLADMKVYFQHNQRIHADPEYKAPQSFVAASLQERFVTAKTSEAMFHVMEDMARLVFENDGFHLHFFYVFDENMDVVDMGMSQQRDQAEKFIHWRHVADRIAVLGAKAVVSIGEAWVRDSKNLSTTATRKLPIVGENLFVTMIESDGTFRSTVWDIVRDNDGDTRPALKRRDIAKSYIPYYFAPVLNAFGVPYPDNFKT